MAAARFSSDLMRTFYEPASEELIQALDQLNAPPPEDVFALVRTDFQEWLRVWRMDVSKENENNNDLLSLQEKIKQSLLI